MSDELRNLEEELARLQPRAPGGTLRARVEQVLDPTARSDRLRPVHRRSPPFRWDRWGPPMTIAAGLLIACGVYHFGPLSDRTSNEHVAAAAVASAPPAANDGEDLQPDDARFRPVRAENALKHRVDEGLVLLDHGLAARRIRLRFVDTVTWQNPHDGAEFEIATPREEIVLVPVHTF